MLRIPTWEDYLSKEWWKHKEVGHHYSIALRAQRCDFSWDAMVRLVERKIDEKLRDEYKLK